LQIKIKNVSCHTADSKPVKQEVNSTVILPPLVFPACSNRGATTFNIMTRSITTFIITTLSFKGLFATFSLGVTQHSAFNHCAILLSRYAKLRYAKFHVSFAVMLSVLMLNVVMPSVIMLQSKLRIQALCGNIGPWWEWLLYLPLTPILLA